MSEINPEEYMRGFDDGRCEGLRHKFEVVAGTPTNIRIEAVRAAVQSARDPDRGLPDRIIEQAKRFERYLESGE